MKVNDTQAAAIKTLREKTLLSATNIANSFGISGIYVYKIYSGERKCNVQPMDDLQEALKVMVNSIYNNRQKPAG